MCDVKICVSLREFEQIFSKNRANIQQFGTAGVRDNPLSFVAGTVTTSKTIHPPPCLSLTGTLRSTLA